MPSRKNFLLCFLLAGAMPLSFHATAFALDAVSAEFATGNRTDIVRLGAQWNWKRPWWQFNGTHIGGYWDVSVARWRGDRFGNVAGSTQHITDIGVTPVWRLQKDTLRGPYAELGIGAHYLSALYDNNDRQLSTRFEFGDHLGIGYVFQNGADIGLRFQHFSNGGIKHPNDGVNLGVVRVSYPFD